MKMSKFIIKTCYNYDNFKNQINMKIQYLKPYSMLCFYFTSEKRILNSIAFNIHIFQNTLYWSKILANKTYIVSCCNFRKKKTIIYQYAFKKMLSSKNHTMKIALCSYCRYNENTILTFFCNCIFQWLYITFSIFEKYFIFNIHLQ